MAEPELGRADRLNDSQLPALTREPLGRFEWERLMRRALIKPPSVKLLGLVMATYANADGTRVRPGQKRLANVMGTSVSTVERGQRALEAFGFIEMVYKGHSAGRGRPGGFASEYRLTVPSDILERIPMLDPDESHPSSMTGISMETPVNLSESPVTSAETPVNLSESPVTGDGPPYHYHHPIDHNKKHQSCSLTLSNARASELQELDERPSLEDERSRQLQALEERMAQEERKAS